MPRSQPAAPKQPIDPRQRIASKINGTTSLQFTKDGKRLIVHGYDHEVRVFDVANGKQTFTIVGDFHFALSPDESKLVMATSDGNPRVPKLYVYDMKTRKKEREIRPANRLLAPLLFTPDGKGLIVGGRAAQPEVMDFATGKQDKVVLIDRTEWLLALTADGKRLAASSRAKANNPVVWDMDDKKVVQALGEVSGEFPPKQLAFSPDGKELAVLYLGGVVVYEAIRTGYAASYYLDPFECVGSGTAIAYSPDGRLMAVVGSEPGVILWDRAARKLHADFTGKTGVDCSAVAFSPDGKTLAVAQNLGDDREILFFDVPPMPKN